MRSHKHAAGLLLLLAVALLWASAAAKAHHNRGRATVLGVDCVRATLRPGGDFGFGTKTTGWFCEVNHSGLGASGHTGWLIFGASHS